MIYACLASSLLDTPFESNALRIPDNCIFDHIYNLTRCWDYDMWNTTASKACKGREMKVKSFSMLRPCGIDTFSGVEFVCCPVKNSMVTEPHQIGNFHSIRF